MQDTDTKKRLNFLPTLHDKLLR